MQLRLPGIVKSNRHGLLIVVIVVLALCLALHNVFLVSRLHHLEEQKSSGLDEAQPNKNVLTMGEKGVKQYRRETKPPEKNPSRNEDNKEDILPINVQDHIMERPKLQSILDRIYIETGTAYSGNLWDISQRIPQWMKDYFEWHKNQREHLAETNWNSHQLWVMQCMGDIDTRCGGTADRLKVFVYVLRQAYKMKRLLFIYWTMPGRLESWLVPPKGGIDWRVPTWMEPILEDYTIGRKFFKVRKITTTNETLVRSRFQSVTGEAEGYNELLDQNELSFQEVYHDVWRIFFTPSKAVAKLIRTEMDRMELVPGEYAAAHLRALYGRIENRTDEVATDLARNAIDCASQLRPGGPFLFASDHTYSTTAALEYGMKRNAKVVTRNHGKLPLHLDKVDNWESLQPSEFYDVFVDLYLMGMSRCLTYNRGGFGQWALLIGYDSSCLEVQKTSSLGISSRCNWTEPDVIRPITHRSAAPLFQDPMD